MSTIDEDEWNEEGEEQCCFGIWFCCWKGNAGFEGVFGEHERAWAYMIYIFQ